MAQWYGTARTNYVEIKDQEGLKAALGPFSDSIKAHQNSIDQKYFMFIGSDPDSGDFPSKIQNPKYDAEQGREAEEEEIEFSFEKFVVPYLAEGQVLVAIVVGAEKQRYLTGSSTAYAWDGRVTEVSINDIYKQAAEEFNVPRVNIAVAEYETLPDTASAEAPKFPSDR